MQPSSSCDPDSAGPESFFAPAARAREADVQIAAEQIVQNVVVDHLLQNHSGWLAVLNRQRQILAVNAQLLRTLGVDDAKGVLGLRPGEAIDCAHAKDHAAGCGTSRFCSTCGAAIAIVVCQEAGETAHRECVLDCHIDGQPATLDLRVQASPFESAGETYVLLYMQDVSAEQRRAAVERAFFHDVNNLLTGLLWTVESLVDQVPPSHASVVHQGRSIVDRIAREVEVQRALSTAQPGRYRVKPVECRAGRLVDQLLRQLAAHPAAQDRQIKVGSIPSALSMQTDPFLVTRILTNMLINALEATPRGGEVLIEAAAEGEERVFTVWNARHIPNNVAMRVFQRYFSTKAGPGRGIGTYSMKLFAEEFLHGAVDFRTNETAGTTFCLRLPRDWPGPGAPASVRGLAPF